MPSDLAISLKNVTKEYRLHGSQADQLIDVLGLQRFGIKPRAPVSTFAVLRNISFDVPHGHRVGIIGRNGAGKTTLLKLICGNFSPTSGEIDVNGTVQALMGVGLGFHPDYTGRQNIEASLHYNGLTKKEYEAALSGIIEFCELGEFLDQPFKTYSLGMQARLMFAAATAVCPNILIVDEVLGAGDAYFVAKSKRRVETLVNSGCTMLLVSHSMSQVLELCEEVIWIDQGEIRMRDDAFIVVKAYEQYIYGTNSNKETGESFNQIGADGKPSKTSASYQKSAKSVLEPNLFNLRDSPSNLLLQEPSFIPHHQEPALPELSIAGFDFEAPGGLSRWDSQLGLKISGFSIVTSNGASNCLLALEPAKFIINIVAEEDGKFDCCYGVALHDHMGACVTRIFSPRDAFTIAKGESRQIELVLNPCQIGPGEYIAGISVTEYSGVEMLNSAKRFDLLARSFRLKVELPESLAAVSCAFFHSAEWVFKQGVIVR
jgi:lipopolysaccharide transport system ATP-binding protein